VIEVKILITGGAGFIGSHLAQSLAKKNQIFVIDKLDDYYSVQQKYNQLEAVKASGVKEIYLYDLLNEAKVKEVFEMNQFDIVIHLAAMPGVTYSIEDPMRYVDEDIKATINVLKYAGITGVKHVIFASSSSVYGDQHGKALSEHMASGSVVSPYAASKFGAESFCHAYEHLYGFKLTIFRFFTVYGPFGRPDMAITKFIKKLIHHEPIEVFGEGTARDYTYVDDIVRGIELSFNQKKNKEIYNLGYGNPVKMEKLLSILQTYFPNMQVNRRPYRQGDVHMTWSDIRKAKMELCYEPSVNIEEGIARTVQWSKSYYGMD
jgi:UDP-glucuronate 4-epimerase